MVLSQEQPRTPLSEDQFQKRLEELETKEKQFMEKYGFYAHYISNNYHTHGLEETHSHPNFQIVLSNLSIEEAHDIFWDFVKQVKEGFVFQANTLVENVVDSTIVKIIKAREDGRNVLRIILPDKKGFFPGDKKCAHPFSLQEQSRFTDN